MVFLENTINNEEILVFSSILFIFIALILINLGKKVIYSIAFSLYLLVLNWFIYNQETNFIYVSVVFSFMMFLIFIQISTEKKKINTEEKDSPQEELSYKSAVFSTPVILLILYIVFLPISYVASSIESSNFFSAKTASYVATSAGNVASSMGNIAVSIGNVASSIGSSDFFTSKNTSTSKSSYADREMAKANWTLYKCSQMGSYELQQNYYSCLSATKHVEANKYRYGM